MRKYLLLLMCLIVSIGAQAQFSGSGSGTSTDPYLIFNPTQLAQMANFLEQTGVVFELKSDIDLTGFIQDNYPSEGWMPIGNSNSKFKGTLKGNGHAISGLAINRASTEYVGLFGYVSGATITNLTLEAGDIIGSNFTGALCGVADGNSNLSKITATINQVKAGHDIGGLIGKVVSCTISNVNLTISQQVSGTQTVGGVFGYFDGTASTVTVRSAVIASQSKVGGVAGVSYGSFNIVSQKGNIVSKGEKTGGIVGWNNSATSSFTSCQSSGTITSTADYTGGIIGYGDFASMTNCSHFGDITGVNYVGGVYGGNDPQSQDGRPVYYLSRSSITNQELTSWVANSFVEGNVYDLYINKCTAVGNISGTQNIGGVVGSHEAGRTFRFASATGASLNHSSGSSSVYLWRDDICVTEQTRTSFGPRDYVDYATLNVANSYYSGNVTGTDNVGGLIGNKISGEVKNCYAYANVVGEANVGGLIGRVKGMSKISSYETNTTLTILSSAAINAIVNATKSNVGRIYGSKEGDYVTIGALGTADGNLSINTTKVVQNGQVQTIADDLQNGSGIGNSMLKLKATYVAKGWNFDSDWTIQETESYPYMKYQTAPPVIETKPISGGTTISGRSVDGGTIYLSYNGGKLLTQACGAGNTWSFTTEPLQSGFEIQVYAQKSGLTASYYASTTVGFPGSGTQEDPYQVCTAADLCAIKAIGYYKLMNDIDLASWISKNAPTVGWKGVELSGTSDASGTITFDGAGHKITGLWVNTTDQYTGLFSNISYGSVKNLTIEVASGKKVKGGNYTGILAGKTFKSSIENVNVKGDAQSSGVLLGGVIGSAQYTTLTSISYEGKLNSSVGSATIGGVAGQTMGGERTVFRCRANVEITCTGQESRVGGVVGSNAFKLLQCVSLGRISSTGSSSTTGGLVALSSGLISDCYSEVTVSGSQYTGGLVGTGQGSITQSYARGNVSGVQNGAGLVAQLDGASAVVQRCVAVNNQLTFTDQSSWAGRVIGGYKNGAADPDNSNYALKTMQVTLNGVATKKYDDLVEGIAQEESVLKTKAFYTELGWDMTEIWTISEGTDYPKLLWEVEANRLQQISLGAGQATLEVNKTLTLTPVYTPASATNKQVVWSSNNESVATVENGVVSAKAIGEAVITATSVENPAISASVTINVVASIAEAIANLRSSVEAAQTLYENSTEGEGIGQYPVGSRAELLRVIDEVRGKLSDSMTAEAVSECQRMLAAAVEAFQNSMVTEGEDTDISLLDNVIYVEPFETGPGQQVKLSVKMKNSASIQGYQFDLYLPEGITVATDEGDFPLAELSTARTTKNKTDYFGSDFQRDGAFRLLCGSTKGYAFSGADGEVCTIMLNVSESMEEGAYPIILKQVTTTSTSNEGFDTPYIKSTVTVSAFSPGDVNGDNKVNITDFTTTANYILGREPAKFVKRAADFNGDDIVNVTDLMSLANYILSGGAPAPARAMVRRMAATAADNYLYLEPVSVNRGGQAVLSVKMKNTENIQGYQTDIYLPEGMTFAQDEDGFYLAEMSTARTTSARMDYFGCDIQSDGALRLLCGSTKGYAFSGTDGEVARVTINIPESMTLGDHTLMLSSSTVTNNANMGFDAEPRESLITVKEAGEESYEEGYLLTIADFDMDLDGDFEASVMLENEDAVKMIEFDVVLPHGLTIENEEGEYFVNLGSRVTSSTVRNQFSGWGEENADGSIHFTAKFNRTTSTYQFTGNEGEALTLLFLAEGLTDGYYQVLLKNILLNGELKVAPSTIRVKVGNPAESTDVTLVDGTPYAGSTDKDCTTLAYTRTFNNTDWQALYVPFQMSYSDWCDDFEVAKINNFHQYDTDNDDEFDDLRMEIIKVKSGTLKQNHPYLIKAKAAGNRTITLTSATLYAAEVNAFVCNSMETTYTFTGTYTGVSGEDMYNENYYSMGGGSLILAEDATANLKPYRWYLKMEGRDGQVIPNPSSVRVMVWDGETSSIESLSLDNVSPTSYSLDGRRVTNARGKGIYITNGQKMLR